MRDFRSYEQYTIDTISLKGETITFYVGEDIDLTLDLDALEGLLNNISEHGQDVATADMLDSQSIPYAASALELEELYASDWNLIDSEEAAKAYILNTISGCLDTESIRAMIGDEPMKSEFVNNELDSLCKDHQIGQEQYNQYAIELSDDDLEQLL